MRMKRVVTLVAIASGIGIGTVASQQPVQAAKSFYITFVRKGYTYDTKGQVAVGKLPIGRWATVVSERNTKTKAYGIKYIHGQKSILFMINYPNLSVLKVNMLRLVMWF